MAWGGWCGIRPEILKELHIVFVIAWLAGRLYLPRLFVYHAQAEKESPLSETFKVMERRLLKAIINPAMVLTWGLGLWLAYRGGWFAAHWLHAKLALVLLMTGVHGILSKYVREFAAERRRINADHFAVDAEDGRVAGGEVQVGGTLLLHEFEVLINAGHAVLRKPEGCQTAPA